MHIWQGGKLGEMGLPDGSRRSKTGSEQRQQAGERTGRAHRMGHWVTGRQLGFIQSGMRSHWSLTSRCFLFFQADSSCCRKSVSGVGELEAGSRVGGLVH